MADRIRLLCCHHCETIQELPWCGEDPQCRHPGCVEPLEARQAEHQFADGRPHAPANLADIETSLWEDPTFRSQIMSNLKRIVNPGAGEGLGETFYDIRSTFGDDAMACWKRHNRTTDCGDYKTSKMKLIPDTRAERKELGLDPKDRANTFLCDFCPMKSIKQTKVNSDRFGFNNPY